MACDIVLHVSHGAQGYVTSVCNVARLGLLPLEVVDRAEYNTR